MAHTLQLIVKKAIFNHKNVCNLLLSCREIVDHFKHFSKSYKILEVDQSLLGLPKYRLIQNEQTVEIQLNTC